MNYFFHIKKLQRFLDQTGAMLCLSVYLGVHFLFPGEIIFPGWLGYFGSKLSGYFVNHLLGVTAFAFVILLLYAANHLHEGKDKYFFINRIPQLFLGVQSFFIFHLIMLNFPFFWDSIYSGLFPKLIYTFFLQTFFTKSFVFLVEIGFLIVSSSCLYFFLDENQKVSLRTFVNRVRSFPWKMIVTAKSIWEEEKKIGPLFKKVYYPVNENSILITEVFPNTQISPPQEIEILPVISQENSVVRIVKIPLDSPITPIGKKENEEKYTLHLDKKDISPSKELVVKVGTEEERTARRLEKTLFEFSIGAKVVNILKGPVVTQYQLTLDPGVKIAKIVGLSDNITLSLAADSVRIVGPIPGKGVIGIEIPNIDRELVRLDTIVRTKEFQEFKGVLSVVLGKTILGEPIIKDLSKMPHLLVAGTTGSGKSVCVNTLVVSLLLKLGPTELRFVMIDPKMVELNVYNKLPHLLFPVLTDSKKSAGALRWLLYEMSRRYSLLESLGVRNIASYNQKSSSSVYGEKFPYIVVVIDELADLMLVARKEVEDSICRLAAMSRAVGIHLVVATQRPSVDVITGLIKANFPTRIAFQVSSRVDSRTILDEMGAESLVGKGDMLFSESGSVGMQRIQCAFLPDDQVQEMIEDLQGRSTSQYLTDVYENLESFGREGQSHFSQEEGNGEGEDPLFEKAVRIVLTEKKTSASYIQRRLKIGYNRSARIVERMEELGIVTPGGATGQREILVSTWNQIQ